MAAPLTADANAERPEARACDPAPPAPAPAFTPGQEDGGQPRERERGGGHQSRVAGVAGACRLPPPRTNRSARRGEREPCDLQPHRRRAPREGSGLEQVAHRAAPYLPARRLEHGVRWRQHDLVGARAQLDRRGARDRLGDRAPAFRVLVARLGDDHQPLGARAPMRRGEDRDAALSNPLDLSGRGFEVVGIEVPPSADDEVLVPARDVELAARHVAPVARAEPVAVEQRTARRRVAEIPRRGGRPAELNRSLRAFADLGAAFVDDPHLEARDRRPAGGEPANLSGRTIRARYRLRPVRDGVGVDGLDPRPPPDRRECNPQGRLRQPVDRSHRVAAVPAGGELRCESLHRVRIDRLGPVEREAPAREIESVELLRLDASHAELVGEVRPAGQRPAVTMNGLQPARRTCEKVEWRHENEGKAVVQAAHPGTDQSHVVVERQPAHEDVARSRPERDGHRPERGEHVAVTQHDALGVAGAARRVLEERRRGFVEGRTLPVPAGAVELGDLDHRAEPGEPARSTAARPRAPVRT